MVELARLESVCAGNRTVGSNPTLSAMGSSVARYCFFLHKSGFEPSEARPRSERSE